ncbi:mechanosensitive ion channel domain-containing protein [uncultured Nisaea sp.]|jgi:small conductance mechanosensitive channel|uniref:mechanosensitive ion channel family protein n=1 Tax=uncultured Nisaea sp. TaxID=538215 RepID=UPI0030EBE702|tara:strand:+ start:224 stop:1060 length:837 start_codon:yes stop_codon:yes gene_type:complete
MNIDVAGEVNVLWEETQVMLATYGFDVVGAILILLFGWILAGWAGRATRSAVDKIAWMDGTVKPLIASVVRYLVVIITVVAVLNRFGVETTSIIAVLGAAGLAVGLALQGTLSNVAAGVMILFLRPFKVGDYVSAGGTGGTVAEVGLFTTELTTPDNVFISVPNSQIINSAVSNFSRHSTRRIDIVVGIGYSSNIDTAFGALMKLAEADERVLADPKPEATVRALADSSVNIGLRFWVNAGDYWPTLFAFNKAVKETLDANGIEIPFPQRVVEMRNAK